MSKVVLVTGASSGMGHEAAILLAKEGHHVYAGARRMGRMADLADYGITAVELDVTNGDDNERVVNQVIEGEGRIDVLINNAGFGLYGPVEDVALEDARYQFEVNLFGLAHLTQLVLPHMREQGSGRIVKVFVEAATTDKPRRRYVKGMLARPALFVRRWLGDGVYEFMLRLAIR